MTKTARVLSAASLALVLSIVATSVEAQRKAPSVEPRAAEDAKEQQAPRLELPTQQKPAPQAPQTSNPVSVDANSNRIRLPGSRLSSSQRKRLAESLANQAVTGVGRATFVEFDKLRVSVPRKIETSLQGKLSLTKGEGLNLDLELVGSRNQIVSGLVGVTTIPSASQPAEFYLVDVHYRDDSSSCNTRFCQSIQDSLQAKLRVRYEAFGVFKSEDVPTFDRPDGVFTFLMDTNSEVLGIGSQTFSFALEGSRIILKAIEVRPVQ